MSLLVVGSVAIDTVETPQGDVSEALGGSAAYFAYAASFFGPVRLVGVVGEDFPDQFHAVLTERPTIDTAGLVRQPGKTFRWRGRYSQDMNSRETLEVHLNVFGNFDPDIPDRYRDSRFIFLANGSPVVQRKVLHQIREPKLVVADTMDLWIETQRDELVELLKQVDGLVLNDSEALMLADEPFIIAAGRRILEMGPKFVIVKKGEHGAMFFTRAGVFSLPAYPVERLIDPTGAGDTFAGGMMGVLAGADNLEAASIKKALAYGTVTASFTVEDFSLAALRRVDAQAIGDRYRSYCEMLRVES